MMNLIQSFISVFIDAVYHYQCSLFNPYLSAYVSSDLIELQWLMLLIVLFTALFITPIVIFILLYTTALVMYIYRHRKELDLIQINNYAHKRYVRRTLLHVAAVLWEAHGRVWHGYEMEGFHHIPENGPALIIFYHGALPLDIYYFHMRCYLYKKRLNHSVGDHFLFMIPGVKALVKELQVMDGPPEECVKILNNGNLLTIAPGGVREALFGDEQYKLLWNNRIGFAKVAIEAKVPIIPVFTQNLREAIIAVKWGRKWFRKLYECTKLPLVPIYGGFPVKLKTIIGEPIPYDPTVTPQQLADRTAHAIQELIKNNQRIPGSIIHAFKQRFNGKSKHS